jgi:hypothetical protein
MKEKRGDVRVICWRVTALEAMRQIAIKFDGSRRKRARRAI